MRRVTTRRPQPSSLLACCLLSSSSSTVSSHRIFGKRPYAFQIDQARKDGPLKEKVSDKPLHISEQPKEPPQPKQLSAKIQCRSLVEARISGTLSTVNLYTHGDHNRAVPLYGSIMPYILTAKGHPIFALSDTTQHKENVRNFAKASLVVHPLTPVDINPSNFALARVNLAGYVQKIEEEEHAIVESNSIKLRYLERHPKFKPWVDKFTFYRMDVSEVYYCDSGLKGTVEIPLQDYENAQVDVVMRDSRGVIEFINEEKRIYLKYFCKEYAGAHEVDDAFMYWADCFGFEVMAWNQKTRIWTEYRFPFPYQMKTAEDCKKGLLDAIKYLEKQYKLDPEVMARLGPKKPKKEDTEAREMEALKEHMAKKAKEEEELKPTYGQR